MREGYKMDEKLDENKKKRIRPHRALICFLFLGYLALCSASSTAMTITLKSMVVNMQNSHQRLPNGVPDSYDWFRHPVIQQRTPPEGFKAITGWGQIYQSDAGNDVHQSVEIKNFKTYIIDDNFSVQQIQSTDSVTGGIYEPSYINNESTPASIIRTPAGGTIAQLVGGHPFQFWPKAGRVNFLNSSLIGIVVTVEARLLPIEKLQDVPLGPAFIISVGADYWKTTTSVWDEYHSSKGIATGRFEILTHDWHCYTMTTITKIPPRLDHTAFVC
jgi:hypothetical protein